MPIYFDLAACRYIPVGISLSVYQRAAVLFAFFYAKFRLMGAGARGDAHPSHSRLTRAL